MKTDPIADFITRMRNANRAGRETTSVPSSKLKRAIAKVLVENEFIAKAEDKDRDIVITFSQDRPVLELRRMSKPGQRRYVSVDEIVSVKNGIGAGIISTSQGILTDKDARRRKLGGELLFTVY